MYTNPISSLSKNFSQKPKVDSFERNNGFDGRFKSFGKNGKINSMLTIQDQKLDALHNIAPNRVNLDTLKNIHLVNKTPMPRNKLKDLPEQRNFDLISTHNLRI